MTISGSEIAVIPKRFSGIRVLLIEPDHTSLVQHAYMLSQNAYRVTSTTRASTGLSMIQNGHLYDCILVDVDIREMDMVDFMFRVLKRQPELSIIVMVSDDIHMMRFVSEALRNEAILCLVKPCDLNDICNIWKHVCRKRMTSEKHDSKGKSLHINNIIRRVDPRFKPFPTLNRAMMNNNIPHEYGSVFKPGYMNFFGNAVGTSATMNTDYKGKQLMDNRKLLEDDTFQEKRTENKRRIYWTKALHGKFLEALNTLGKENAYPSEILKHMNVPGLTRNHVASHLQKLQGVEKVIKKPRLAPVAKMGDNLQAGSYASKRSGQLTLSGNHGSIVQSSSLQGPLKELNSEGTLYMSLDNIKARLQESALLVPVPQTTTTTMSNSGGDQVTDHSSGDTFQLPMGETSLSCPTSGNSEDGSGSGFSEALTPLCFDASGGGAMSEPLAEFDCFGIPIEPFQVIGMGSVEDHGLGAALEPLVCPVAIDGQNCNMGTGETSIFPLMTKPGTGGGVEPLISNGLEDLVAAMSPNFFKMACNSGGGGTETSLANKSPEDLALHEFLSHELGGLSDQALDFQGNGDDLFMGVGHHPTTHSNSDLEAAGSVGLSFPGEGSNSGTTQAQIPAPVNSDIGYLGGTFMDFDDPFPEMTEFDVERTMQILDEVDIGDLINAQWQFS